MADTGAGFYVPPEETAYGDYVDAFQAGSWGIAAGLYSLADTTEASIWRDYFNDKVDQNTREMTPGGRAQFEADIGSSKFYESPIGWTVMQTVGSSPYILASLAPVAVTGGAGGLLEAGAISGALSAGDITNNITQTIEGMSEEEKERSPTYANAILNGASPEEATQELLDLAIGNKPAWAFLAGIGTAYLGTPGAVTRAVSSRVASRAASRLVPEYEGGFIARGTKEALSSSAGEYAQSATEQGLQEEANVQAGLQPSIDWGRVNRAGLTGVAVAGPMGGVVGAIGGAGRGTTRPQPSTEPPPPAIRTVTEPFAGSRALVQTRPNFTLPPPPPGSSGPHGPETGGTLGNFRRVGQPYGALPVVTDALSPSPEQQVALRAQTPLLAGEPPSTELAGATRRQYPGGGYDYGPYAEYEEVPQGVARTGAAPPPSTGVFERGPTDYGEYDVVSEGQIPADEREGLPSPPTRQGIPAPEPIRQRASPEEIMRAAPFKMEYADAVARAEQSGWSGPYSRQVNGRWNTPGWKPIGPSRAPQRPISPKVKAAMDIAAARQTAREMRVPLQGTEYGESPIAGAEAEVLRETPEQRALAEEQLAELKVTKRPLPERTKEAQYVPTEREFQGEEGRVRVRGGEVVEGRYVPPKEATRAKREGVKVGGPGWMTGRRYTQRLERQTKERAAENLENIERIEEIPLARWGKGVARGLRHVVGGKPQYTGKIGKSAIAQREEGEKEAQKILKSTPAHLIPYDTPKARQRLFDRLRRYLSKAKALGVKIPDAVTEKTLPGIGYLTTVRELVNREDLQGGATDKHIADFLLNENEIRKGDATALYKARKAETPQVNKADKLPEAMSPEEALIEAEERAAQAVPEAGPEPKEVPEKPEGPEYQAVKPQTAFEAAYAKARQKKAAKEKAAEPEPKPEPEAPKGGNVTTKPKPPKVAAAVQKAKELKQKLQSDIKQARKDIDKKATPAQKEVNAKVGRIKDNGLRVSETHDVGEMRNGVEAPAIYGYIEGTKAPDGRPIDVWINPDATNLNVYYVIDQKDLITGQFDEPKAMMGFDSANDAVKVYAKSFADKRGLERIMGVTPMTRAQFKRWAHSKKASKYPAGDPNPKTLIRLVRSGGNKYKLYTGSLYSTKPINNQTYITRSQAMDAAQRWVAADPDNRALHPSLQIAGIEISDEEGAGIGDPEHFGSIEAYLTFKNVDPVVARNIDFDKLMDDAGYSGLQRRIYKTFWDKVIKTAGDVRVFFTPDEIIRAINASSGGFYAPTENIAAVSDAVVNEHPRIVLHELVHAAFMKALTNNTRLRNIVGQIAREYLAATQSGSYEMRNADEFFTEAMSNIAIMQRLLNIRASDKLRRYMQARRGVGILEKAMSLWDALRHTVMSVLGIPYGHESLFDAVMHVGHELERRTPQQEAMEQSEYDFQQSLITNEQTNGPFKSITLGSRPDVRRVAPISREALSDTVSRVTGDIDQYGAPRFVKLRGLDNLVQLAKQGGPAFGKAARKLGNAIERMRVRSQQISQEAARFLQELDIAQKQFRGAQWDEFVNFMHDATVAQLDPSKPLAGQRGQKDEFKSTWTRAQYPELRNRYMALPPELKLLHRAALEHYEEFQNRVQQEQITRILEAAGINDPALGQRLFEGQETEADIATLGPELYDHIQDTHELVRLNGYTPQMRHGDHVVSADFEIRPPTNAVRQMADDQGRPIPVWEFETEEAAQNFAKRQETFTRLRPVHVNEAGNLVSGKTPDAIKRYRVSVQNRHVEFFQSLEEASKANKELLAKGFNVKYWGVRSIDTVQGQDDLMSHQMRRLVRGLQNRPSYQNLSTAQRNEVMRALIEQSIRLLGSTRIQSRHLPRYNVLGASRDFVRNAHLYNRSMSGYLAKLENRHEVDEAGKELLDLVQNEQDYGKLKQNFRQEMANELVRRANNTDVGDPRESAAFNFVGSVAFTRFLASPAYTAIQLLQPVLLTIPRLAARYGWSRAVRMAMRLYGELRADKIMAQGFKETFRKAKGAQENYGFFDRTLQQLSGDEKRAMEYLYQHGVFGLDAGLEIEQGVHYRRPFRGTLRSTGEQVTDVAQIGADWANGVARALPRAAETTNRFVSALLAYRLEKERNGGDHDAATLFAQEITNATQGLYSHTDAPDIFKNKWARFPFLFRRYASLVYDHLGTQLGLAFNKDMDAQTRREAQKTLLYTAVAHVAMAGVMGLPTEPIKLMLMAASAVMPGVPTWDEVEAEYIRGPIASLLGPQLGEIIAHGLPRAVGVDLSTRVGLSDMLLPPGEINMEDDRSVYAYLGEIVLGAPGSMLLEGGKGLQQAYQGEWGEAAQRLIPIKAVQDSIRAFRQATEGKKSEAGYETVSPYNIGEAFLRGMGFAPGREAESQERRSFFYAKTQRQDQERNDILHDYLTAKPSEKPRVIRRALDWNKDQTKDRRLSVSEMDAYVKRRKHEDVKYGIRLNKTNRDLFRSTQEVYNIR